MIILYTTSVENSNIDFDNNVNCKYYAENTTLSCNNGAIECASVMNFTGLNTTVYKNFGISLVPQQERVILPELIKFYLYPAVDTAQNVFSNFTKQLGFKFHRFSIYYARHMFDDGFRVEDIDCYSRLVNYMRKSKLEKVVRIKENNNGESQNATMLGFVNIISGLPNEPNKVSTSEKVEKKEEEIGRASCRERV